MSALRNILVLGHHDVRRFLRDRAAYIWLLLVPLGFTLVMGRAIRGGDGPADSRPLLVLDNRDTGYMGRVFAAELGEQGLTLRTPQNQGDAKRGIVVPEDFTERVISKQSIELEFFEIEGADMGSSQLVEIRLVRTLTALNVRLARYAIDHPNRVPTEDALIAMMKATPPVILESEHATPKARPVGFGFSLPGNLVGYLFLNLLIFGGSSVAENRRSGVLRRIAVSPLTRLEVLFGKIYGLILLGGVQVIVFLLLGQFVFGLEIAESLAGILVALVVFAWVGASLGVLIGFLVKAEDKVVGLCLAIGLPTIALGGCWWPLEVAPQFLQQLAHVVPTGWAVDALHQLITYGGGLADAAPAIGVLVLFGLAANLAAARFFRV